MSELWPVQLLPESLSLAAAIFLIVVSAVTSAISATFGLGGGVAMLLALLMVTTPAVALPVHGIIQIGSNAGRAWMMRAHVMKPVAGWFLPGTLIGVFVASFVFVTVSAKSLQLILGCFVLWALWAPKFKTGLIRAEWFLPVGILGSFCTMFVGATGPLLAIFLNPVRYGRDATVSTHATCMTVQHSVKVLAFGLLGFVFAPWVLLLLAMVLSGLVGTWIGGRLLSSIPEDTFKRIFKGVLTVLALRLLYVGLS